MLWVNLLLLLIAGLLPSPLKSALVEILLSVIVRETITHSWIMFIKISPIIPIWRFFY